MTWDVYVNHSEPTSGFIVVHADPVQLQVAVSVVGPRRVDAVLVADHLPELNKNTGRCTSGYCLLYDTNI